MLSKRCPFTGIINFYTDLDPHLAVGSIARDPPRSPSQGFTWRCYTDDNTSGGIAPDLQTAERRLINFLALIDHSQSATVVRAA